MTAKDIVSKHLLKRIALDMARLLLGLDVADVEILENDNQRVEDRRADLLAKAKGGEGDYLLHIEIQNDNQRIIPWRMLRYRVDIGLAHPGIAVRQYLIYIGRAALSMPDGINEQGLDYRYRIVDMHSVDCRTLFAQDTPDALVMAILCDFRGSPERDVVRRILRRLLELTGADEAAFRDYLLMLEILSSNRDLKQIVQEEEAMLSQVKYSDLPSYGLGMQQGMEQGMQQGMQQGEVLMLLHLLERKFGSVVPETIRQRVQMADRGHLLEWSGRVLTADTLEAVFGEG